MKSGGPGPTLDLIVYQPQTSRSRPGYSPLQVADTRPATLLLAAGLAGDNALEPLDERRLGVQPVRALVGALLLGHGVVVALAQWVADAGEALA